MAVSSDTDCIDSSAMEASSLPSSLVVCGLVSVSLIYGGWSLIAKATLTSSGIAPLVLASYRCLGAAFIMLMGWRFVEGKPGTHTSRAILQTDVPRFVLLGLLMAANMGGNILALSELSALTVSIFQPMLPVFSGAFAALLRIEELTLQKVVGITFCAGGAIMVIALGEHSSNGGAIGRGSFSRGVMFLLMNVAGGAMYCVLQKSFLRTNSPILLAGLAQLVAGSILFLAAVGTVGLSVQIWDIRGKRMVLLALCYCIFLTTAYNYSMLAWATRETTPTTVTGFLTLQPVFASLLSWRILGVALSPWQAFGGFVILTGLLIFCKTSKLAMPTLAWRGEEYQILGKVGA